MNDAAGPANIEETLRLIAITDNLRDGIDGLVARATAAVRGGATMVQVRLKDADARTLTDVTRRLVATLSVPVVVNDRVDVALAAGAAGVHVGIDDLPVSAVRGMVPAHFIVGASFGSDDEFENARHADYVGIGPVFSTSSKGDAGAAIGVAGFSALRAKLASPAVAIGGVNAENAGALASSGASGVAVIAAVFAARDPERAARELAAAMHI
jgi:thiamine-phosphate pyrophosphorylase